MKFGARLSHQLLYALMIVMPLLGLGMLWAAAYPVVLYGGIRIPALLPQSDLMHTLLWNAHVYLGFAFFALVLLHLAAGLFHALIRRDGVFASMSLLPLRDRVTQVRTARLDVSNLQHKDADHDQSRPPKPDGSRSECEPGRSSRAESAARRRFRSLPEDQELPLARVGQPLSRLPPYARRAGRPNLRHD
jgi:hypothetical protein